MLKHLPALISMDWPTLAVILLLCAFASYFLKEYLAQPTMIVFVYPVLVLCSLVFEYLLIFGEVFAFNRLEQWLMWTILACIGGTVVGTAVVATLAALREKFDRKRMRLATTRLR